MRFLGAALLALAGRGWGMPADPGRTRPEHVAATPFVQRDVVVRGLRLRYIDEGQGPAVLLIPGHTSRIEEYDSLTAALRPRYRVLIADLPGSGYSDKPDRPYSLAFYEDTLLGFLDALNVSTCAVAGGSLGGNLALRLAYREPKRFVRVVAWGPASSWPARRWLAWTIRRLAGYALFWPTVRFQSRYWYSKDWPGRKAALAGTFAYYHEILGPGFVRMYWDIAAEQMGWSLTSVARDISTPTLLLWGDRDDGGGMKAGVARLRSLLPHSELVVFPKTKHCLVAEKPAETAAAVLEFLSRPADKLP